MKLKRYAIFRWYLLWAILTIGCLRLGLAADDDLKGNRPASAHSDISGMFSSTMSSGQVKPGGWFIEGTTASERLFLNRTNNLASGDQLRGMALISMDLDSQEPSDGTFGIEYGNATTLLGRIVGGYTRPYFGDRLSIGYQYWKLKERVEATASHFIYGRWDHSSRAEWALTAMYGFPCDGCKSAGLVEFRMTDSWPIPGVRGATRLIPLVGVSYGVNYYGTAKLRTAFALGIGVTREIHRRVRLGLNLEGQRHLGGNETKDLDRTWGSAVVDFLF